MVGVCSQPTSSDTGPGRSVSELGPFVRVRIGKQSGSGCMKNVVKIIIFDSLKTVFLGQVPPKPNQRTSFRLQSLVCLKKFKYGQKILNID